LKQVSIFIILALVLTSCHSGSGPETGKSSTGKVKFFDYDQVDYYHYDFPEEKLSELYNNKSPLPLVKLKSDLLIGDVPANIWDLDFLNKISQVGYSKKTLTSHFQELDEIFSEHYSDILESASCINVYRDIIVFKKQSKVVGIVKICFGCGAAQFTGARGHTDDFGQNGEYAALEKILKAE
jgi:hypothetical protein